MLPLLVFAAAAFCGAAEQQLADQVSLLQAELERARAPKAQAPVEVEDGGPEETICQQLAGKDGSCERLMPEPTDLLHAAPQEEASATVQAVPEQQQPAKPVKNAASSALGYVLDVLVVLLIIDGGRRWYKARTEQEPEAEAKSWDSLMQAALAGDAARCEKLMGEGVDITGADLWGCTVLHAASKGGSMPVVAKLLERGAKVDETDSWDDTPLHLAARAGHGGICELLLAHGAPIDATNAQDWTPLVVAADADQEAVCRRLLEKGGSAADLKEEALPPLLASLLAEAEEGRRKADEEEAADFARRIEEEYWQREQAAEDIQ